MESTDDALEKELALLGNGKVRIVQDQRHRAIVANPKRWPWKAKTRVMLLFSVVSLALFVLAAYLINSYYMKQTRDKQNVNFIAEEIDSSLSFPACGNRSTQTRGCPAGSLCASRIRRLIGGSLSSSNSWPWMGGIIYKNKHYCGAVLISLNVLLTAAHCMFHDGGRLYSDELQVKLGSKYRLSTEDDKELFQVSRIFIHYSFKLPSLENDIAIITLDRHVAPTKSIWPICVSGLMDVKSGTNAVMTGWGKTSYDGAFSTILREARVPVASTERCSRANKGLFDSVSVSNENNICAGYGESRPEYGCNGDSGGPLMVETSDQRWTVIGIMSWGGPTCSSLTTNSYTVFTKLQSYRKWINDIINILG